MFCMNAIIFLLWITSSERRLGPPIFFIGQTQDRKRKLVLEKQITKSPKSKNSYMHGQKQREKDSVGKGASIVKKKSAWCRKGL
jgi:hypothetical protein